MNWRKPLGTSSGQQLQQAFWKTRRVWLTALVVAGCVLGVRSLGALQTLELRALDQLFLTRPEESPDPRITLITIDDIDIQHIGAWPIPDGVIAQALQTVRSHHPRAIGLDLYRDIPVQPGTAELQAIFASTPNLIGIEKLEDELSVGVKPPPVLAEQNRVGFNNVVVDSDSRVRRSILFWRVNDQLRQSFALKLALLYLRAEGIEMQGAVHNPNLLQLGNTVFPQFFPNDGGYVRTSAGGYQILANPRSPAAQFDRVPLSRLLRQEIDPALFRDRIVLIGSTAASLKDFFYTSYSESTDGSAKPISGVELHAQFTSQILSAALEGRSPLNVWPDPLEWLWVLAWSGLGAGLVWTIRRPSQSTLMIALLSGGLFGLCYVAFLGSWWIPLVPSVIALVGSAVGITGYIAFQEEELKKSKEFLNSVINTIPDPVFVKDQHHQWIVLNDAFCRLVGQAREHLLEKSEGDFLPPHQAALFWMKDTQTFATGIEQETEEEFTNSEGVTYLIATKRSLHRDAAGNVFLVGVIRDITHRKRVEEELRRTAAELVRSNAELRQAEDRLRQMAYHDGLTGLPNRQLFLDRLHQAIAWATERDQMVALLFLDLDGFKQINDNYGHDMGNLLLKAIAQRLSGCLRSSDTVARLGGDEFVVLLPGIPSVQDVVKVADKLLDTLARPFILEGYTIPVTTSIGISMYPLDDKDPDALLKKADLAMYEAKRLGKRRYEFVEKN